MMFSLVRCRRMMLRLMTLKLVMLRDGGHILCKPAQLKFTSRSRKRHATSDRTMPPPRLGQERKRTLCASLRGRNACPHVTRDMKSEMPKARVSTLIFVWTHCLGDNRVRTMSSAHFWEKRDRNGYWRAEVKQKQQHALRGAQTTPGA